jgi:nitrite reductase/ring-hydroxylating ferredoxin subunit
MSDVQQPLDLERVICRLNDIPDPGARGFTMGQGDWPLRGFVVRVGNEARAYVNSCPHARHPLNLGPNRFLTPRGELILCSSHGALFDKLTGFCVAGPCAGQSLQRVDVKLDSGFVMLADHVDPQELADRLQA